MLYRVSEDTTYTHGYTPKDHLTLKFRQTFVIHLRNVRQMNKSICPYPLHSLSINIPLLYVSQHHLFSMHLFYYTFLLEESSRVRGVL
jgi:hypothetical protein